MTTDQRNQLISIIKDKNWSNVQDALKGLGMVREGEERTRQKTITKDAKRVELEAELRQIIEGAGLATWPLPESVGRKEMRAAITNAVDDAANKIPAMRLGNQALFLCFELAQIGVTESDMRAAHFGQSEYTVTETYNVVLPSLWE